MATQENLKPLKTLVISMGFILAGGTVLLAALVWQKISEPRNTVAISNCPGGQVDLKGWGSPVSSAVEGSMLRLLFHKLEGDEVVTIDLCSGRVIGTLIVEADGKIPPL